MNKYLKYSKIDTSSSVIQKEALWSCLKKSKYNSEEFAIKIIEKRLALDKRIKQLNVYKCIYCDGWHITKKNLRK